MKIDLHCFLLYIFQVFTRLIKVGSPKSSFPIYSMFFQEACSLALLETCIFHVDVAENLEDAGTDLLDYCVRNITHLIYPIDEDGGDFVPEGHEEKLVRQELLEQVKDLREVMGLRCLSIVRCRLSFKCIVTSGCQSLCRYMTDHISVLTLGVLARFVTTHDLPGVCAAAIQCEPWRRDRNGKDEVWRDGLWNEYLGSMLFNSNFY